MDFHVIRQQIERVYPDLSPRLKSAARHALDHPDDIALLSMRQFAAKADVHPSTMVRLAKVLEFDGYEAFRKPFQSRLRTGPEAPYSRSARSIQARGPGNARAMFDEMMRMEHANLDSVAETLGYDALAHCAEAIARARHVYVGGIRSCYPVAFHFHYACRMFEDKISLLDGRGGTFADGLRGVGKGDILLAISFAPYSRNIVHAVGYASDRGASVIALTDSALSPLLKGKKTTPLILRTSSPSFFHSIVPVISVVQALSLLLVANGGKQALGRLSESEAQLSAFDAYWSDDRADGRE